MTRLRCGQRAHPLHPRRPHLRPHAALGSATAPPLVSGGFDVFAEQVRRHLGIDVRLRQHAGGGRRPVDRATPSGEIIDGPAKARLLETIAADEGIPLEQTVAVGDGSNDLRDAGQGGPGDRFQRQARRRCRRRRHAQGPLPRRHPLRARDPRKDIEAADRATRDLPGPTPAPLPTTQAPSGAHVGAPTPSWAVTLPGPTPAPLSTTQLPTGARRPSSHSWGPYPIVGRDSARADSGRSAGNTERISSATRVRWSSVRLDPDGRHNPRRTAAPTPPPRTPRRRRTRAAGASASTPAGPRCPTTRGASRIASRSTPAAAGSTVNAVSQRVGAGRRRLRHELDPGQVAERLAGRRVVVAPPAATRSSSGQLAAAEGGEQVAQPVVEADLRVLVVRRRLARLGGEVARPGRCGSASSETSMPPPLVVMILLPLKERRRRCARTTRPAGRVGGAQRLGGVLDQRDAVALAQRRGSVGSRRTGRRGRPVTSGAAGRPSPLGRVERLGEQAGIDVPGRPARCRRTPGSAPT